MGWDLIPPFANIHPDHPVGVDWVALVGIDNHAEEARVGLEKRFNILLLFSIFLKNFSLKEFSFSLCNLERSGYFHIPFMNYHRLSW